jgi:hypothetical protein
VFGVCAFCVVHPTAPVLGQDTGFSQQACQNTESNGGPENKNAQTSNTKRGKHKNLKARIRPLSVGRKDQRRWRAPSRAVAPYSTSPVTAALIRH